MNLIIGILGRPKTIDKDIFSFSKSITDVITSYGHIPLGIIPPITDINTSMTKREINKLHHILDLCDGVILQGGTDFYQYDLEAIKYLYEKNIPVLGICLGMQTIGVFFEAQLVDTSNHNHTGINHVHEVILEDGSKMKKMLGKSKIMVNSRHNQVIINPSNVNISGYYKNIIEAIESRDKSFFIGVQWHPEDMIKYDEEARKLFEELFSSCKVYNCQKNKL